MWNSEYRKILSELRKGKASTGKYMDLSVRNNKYRKILSELRNSKTGNSRRNMDLSVRNSKYRKFLSGLRKQKTIKKTGRTMFAHKY